MTWLACDYQFMSRAIQLAKRGRYTCDPNPRVGCVITKNGKIIAEGWHAVCGQAHAEIRALEKCQDVSGSTVYVTLEPCAHHGRTPPCVDALIKAKVKEVIIAASDPNPLVAGSGIKKLKEVEISVKQGLFAQQATKLNPGFIRRMTVGLPYVRCKMAMSLDGRTALANGESQWISSAQSRKDVHRLRAASSAALTTVDTLVGDDVSLNARDIGFDVKQPVRIIIDRQLNVSSRSKIFTLGNDVAGNIIIYTENDKNDRVSELTDVGAKIVCLPRSKTWLNDVFSHMAKEYEINEVMVEAGATFSGVLIQSGLVNELVVYMAAILLGDCAKPLFRFSPLDRLNDAKKLKLTDLRQLGKDIRLIYSL